MTVSSLLAMHCAALLALAVSSMAPPGKKRGKRNDPSLCDAAASGKSSRVRKLLASGASENSTDEDGTTALMAAAFAGETELVGLLLDAGADPNLQDDTGFTAIMHAVIADCEMGLESGHEVFLGIIETLLDRGADPSLEDEDGLTASDHAAACDLADTAELLAVE
jgi:ankyrin repeat protein